MWCSNSSRATSGGLDTEGCQHLCHTTRKCLPIAVDHQQKIINHSKAFLLNLSPLCVCTHAIFLGMPKQCRCVWGMHQYATQAPLLLNAKHIVVNFGDFECTCSSIYLAAYNFVLS